MVSKTLGSRLDPIVSGGRNRPRRGAAMKPAVQWLEERCLMAVVPIPTNPRVDLSQIMWNGETQPLRPVSQGGLVGIPAPYQEGATKTITITNNGPETIYPVLRTQNIGETTKGNPNAPYDPQDIRNLEYRAYIGFTDSMTGQQLGLPSKASITIQVPLVLWDGDNLYIATDGTNLTTPEIFHYDPSAAVTILGPGEVESGTTWVQGSANYPPGQTPLVMFYRAKQAITLPDDAPAQLTEVTFRDPYLKHFINDSSQTFALLNYDVSYVNNLVAPIAMQAKRVPITFQSGKKPTPPPTYYGYKDFGWLATTSSTKNFGGSVTGFVTNKKPASVGNYFGNGEGWPSFYNPSQTDVSIPAGSNLFADSPLSKNGTIVHVSSYDQNQWMLSSAGDAPIQAGGRGVGLQGYVTEAQPNRLSIPSASPQFVKDLAQMLKLKGSVVNVTFPSTTTQVLATVLQYVPASGNNAPYLLLSQPIEPSGSSGKVYAVTRPASDYAVTAITNLWYSWANYHVQNQASFGGEADQGTVTYKMIANKNLLSNVIHLDSAPAAVLVPGMTVTDAAGIIPQGTTILKVDGLDVHLSQLPAANTPAGTKVTLTFGKPVQLPYDPRFVTPYTLSFDGTEKPNADKFAASVYEAMAAQVAVTSPPFSELPDAMDVVARVIQFYAVLPGNKEPYGPTLVGEVRDVVKSILRGVYDFNAVPDQSKWYPDPSKKPQGLTSNQDFNVYNLDPYVWFVHKVEGMSAYGFSVDDDVSNPTATGPELGPNGEVNHSPSQLQIGYGGIDGWINTDQWFPTLPWGTIQTQATLYVPSSGNYKDQGIVKFASDDALTIFAQIIPPGAGQVGAYITAPGYITPGTTLTFKGPNSLDIPEFVLSQPPLQTTDTPIAVTITGILPATTTNRTKGTRPVTLGRVVPKAPVTV